MFLLPIFSSLGPEFLGGFWLFGVSGVVLVVFILSGRV